MVILMRWTSGGVFLCGGPMDGFHYVVDQWLIILLWWANGGFSLWLIGIMFFLTFSFIEIYFVTTYHPLAGDRIRGLFWTLLG
jgi:hypothetical protein